jgi:hypothetical protein
MLKWRFCVAFRGAIERDAKGKNRLRRFAAPETPQPTNFHQVIGSQSPARTELANN